MTRPPLTAEELRALREIVLDGPPYTRIARETVLRLLDGYRSPEAEEAASRELTSLRDELERLRAENEQLRQDISFLRPDR